MSFPNLDAKQLIYIYGETDEDKAQAAILLSEAGYQNSSNLRGGVAAWKAVGFPIESMFRCA